MLEPDQGLSLRGTSDNKLISGDVLRKLWVKMEENIALTSPLDRPPTQPSPGVKARQRASRGAVDVAEAGARAQPVVAQLIGWYNEEGGAVDGGVGSPGSPELYSEPHRGASAA